MADAHHMAVAQRLATRGLGRVAPNPAVGCVIVSEGRVVGRGITQPSGRPHAETVALDQAGKAASGATVYVTLEPCAHTGETLPCVDALIAARVGRVVIACEDPDPRTAGLGIERLIEAGISVSVGIGRDAALKANAGFFLKVRTGRPLFALKMATSLDGKIATATGRSQWITGDAARARGHLLRATHDAILIGSGTALADNPSLTCRLPGMENRNPIRLVLDSRGQTLNADLSLFDSVGPPTKVFVGSTKIAATASLPKPHRVIAVDTDDEGHVSPIAVAKHLAEQGITRVLIEGGSGINAAFLQAGLIDQMHAFRAPKVIGEDGLCAIGDLSLDDVTDAVHFQRTHLETLGPDVYEAFDRQNLLGLLAD